MTAVRLRAVRQALGLTQSELGELLGLHYATINRAETGVRPLSPWHAALLDRLGQGAGVDVKSRLVSGGPIDTLVYLLTRTERPCS